MTITLDQQEWDKLPALDALAEGSKTPGDLAHAMRAAQQFIKKYQKYTYIIQVTGKLRLLELKGHKVLEIIAYSKPVTDLTGQKIPGANELTNAIAANPKFKMQAGWADDSKHLAGLQQDALTSKHYTIIITHLVNKHQLPITQIVLSSSDQFTDAMTRMELPWGHSIKNARLQPPNGKPPLTPTENAYFDLLGYNHIPVDIRQKEDPQMWVKYKRE